jgi:hypothetical protein
MTLQIVACGDIDATLGEFWNTTMLVRTTCASRSLLLTMILTPRSATGGGWPTLSTCRTPSTSPTPSGNATSLPSVPMWAGVSRGLL